MINYANFFLLLDIITTEEILTSTVENVKTEKIQLLQSTHPISSELSSILIDKISRHTKSLMTDYKDEEMNTSPHFDSTNAITVEKSQYYSTNNVIISDFTSVGKTSRNPIIISDATQKDMATVTSSNLFPTFESSTEKTLNNEISTQMRDDSTIDLSTQEVKMIVMKEDLIRAHRIAISFGTILILVLIAFITYICMRKKYGRRGRYSNNDQRLEIELEDRTPIYTKGKKEKKAKNDTKKQKITPPPSAAEVNQKLGISNPIAKDESQKGGSSIEMVTVEIENAYDKEKATTG